MLLGGGGGGGRIKGTLSHDSDTILKFYLSYFFFFFFKYF